MTNQQEVELLAMCSEFFAESLHNATTLYGIAKWAFIIAVFLLALQGIAAVWALFKASQGRGDGMPGVSAKGSPVDIVKALPALIDSLAKAPAPIVLMAAGLLLTWVPTVDAPVVCEEPLSRTVGASDSGDGASDSAAGSGDAATGDSATAAES